MTTTDYAVTGMTCAHCVAAVAEEVSAVPGVEAVDIDLVIGGESRVTVTSSTEPDRESIAAAVDEAGYALVSS
ncbi:heavy-metal-associated domain-containing protein [Planctomonas psychrotolerans]|uniref:heavy-metal-associated domain-containing protein n=1 Tax=Planctomonas psychrotolerans TaxID=2528712 RepID=UPI00123AE4A3|nr:heavy metal-associated domain-containing protein [Planctomonas psychrotolerans]